MIHVATSAPQIDDGDNIQLVSPVQCDETSTTVSDIGPSGVHLPAPNSLVDNTFLLM